MTAPRFHHRLQGEERSSQVFRWKHWNVQLVRVPASWTRTLCLGDGGQHFRCCTGQTGGVFLGEVDVVWPDLALSSTPRPGQSAAATAVVTIILYVGVNVSALQTRSQDWRSSETSSRSHDKEQQNEARLPGRQSCPDVHVTAPRRKDTSLHRLCGHPLPGCGLFSGPRYTKAGSSPRLLCAHHLGSKQTTNIRNFMEFFYLFKGDLFKSWSSYWEGLYFYLSAYVFTERKLCIHRCSCVCTYVCKHQRTAPLFFKFIFSLTYSWFIMLC